MVELSCQLQSRTTATCWPVLPLTKGSSATSSAPRQVCHSSASLVQLCRVLTSSDQYTLSNTLISSCKRTDQTASSITTRHELLSLAVRMPSPVLFNINFEHRRHVPPAHCLCLSSSDRALQGQDATTQRKWLATTCQKHHSMTGASSAQERRSIRVATSVDRVHAQPSPAAGYPKDL